MWCEADTGAGERADARARARPLAEAPRRNCAVQPPRRPASCGPAGTRRRSIASQTVDSWPEPYEFLVADLFGALPDEDKVRCTLIILSSLFEKEQIHALAR